MPELGYHFDYYYSIQDEKLILRLLPRQLLTPHYAYSTKYNFNTKEYIVSGLSANFVYDSRDNQTNPYKGIYANINYRYKNFLGAQDSSELWIEFRTYVGLSKKKPRHLVAFWAFGDFNLTGHLPYMTLPALGDDQRARSGRGYINGRFRGRDHCLRRGRVSVPDLAMFQYHRRSRFCQCHHHRQSRPGRRTCLSTFNPPLALDIRIMVNKHFRTNINIDYSFGVKSNGFYFSGQETF